MLAVLQVFILSSSDFIKEVFQYIFPEYPEIGSYVVGICLLIFVFYILKSGLKHAFKISFMLLFAFVFVLFSVHSVGKLLRVSVTF